MRRVAELMDLRGRVAVITGGAGHLGRAFGEALCELGARVVVVDRDRAATEARAAELASHGGGEALGVAVDLAGPEAAGAVVAAARARFGGVDILVNNAAYTGDSRVPGYAVPVAQQTLAAWQEAMRVNLDAAFALTQALADDLAASGRGAVVNVASIYGLVGPDFRLYEGTAMGNPAAYAASKGGLLQLTRYYATALAPRVRVNAISPGGVARGQGEAFTGRYVSRTPLGRMAIEEDLKGAIAFLVGDAAAYVTGHNLIVDGGFTAW